MHINLTSEEINVTMKALKSEFDRHLDAAARADMCPPINGEFVHAYHADQAHAVLKVATIINEYSRRFDGSVANMSRTLEDFAVKNTYHFKAYLSHAPDVLYAQFDDVSLKGAEKQLLDKYGPIIQHFEQYDAETEDTEEITSNEPPPPEYLQDPKPPGLNHIFKVVSKSDTDVVKYVPSYADSYNKAIDEINARYPEDSDFKVVKYKGAYKGMPIEPEKEYTFVVHTPRFGLVPEDIAHITVLADNEFCAKGIVKNLHAPTAKIELIEKELTDNE